MLIYKLVWLLFVFVDDCNVINLFEVFSVCIILFRFVVELFIVVG